MTMFKEKDLAWMAGFFDGEGSISIGRPSNSFEIAESASFRLALMDYHGGPR